MENKLKTVDAETLLSTPMSKTMFIVDNLIPQELYAEIFRQRTYHCAECKAAFVPNSNRQKYCPACSRKVHRKQKNESAKKHRADS